MPILVFFAVSALLACGIVVVSRLLNFRHKAKTDLSTYECGVEQAVLPRRPFAVQFFVIALAFLVFDVEAALFYPIAITFRRLVAEGHGLLIAIEAGSFLFIFVLALYFLLRERVLR